MSESKGADVVGAVPQFSDSELLNWLEVELLKGRYTGKAVFRLSMHGRGWRLHETSSKAASDTVRGAITRAMLDASERADSGANADPPDPTAPPIQEPQSTVCGCVEGCEKKGVL